MHNNFEEDFENIGTEIQLAYANQINKNIISIGNSIAY
jgi:hypothetical protein